MTKKRFLRFPVLIGPQTEVAPEPTTNPFIIRQPIFEFRDDFKTTSQRYQEWQEICREERNGR